MREGGLRSGGRGRTRGPLWRWRRNPLRRRTDVLEAWFLLAVWVLVVVGGTLVGLVTARAAGQSFDRQRTERTQVRAVLLTDAPRTAVAGTGGDLTSARVRWTAPDGTRHSDSTLVPGGLRAGSTAEIWLDAWGRPSSAPLTSGEASAESALLGVSAALCPDRRGVRRPVRRTVVARPAAHRGMGPGVGPARSAVGPQDRLTGTGPLSERNRPAC
ncbi:hypothetical protein ABT133_03405 [Streptomyces sp. NPDC001835]|uniref:Rv1733c family protein n=1 Tax=Streptomyces sp. NPDC001835 TaxID=3154528 RepID=UPI00332DA91F